LKAQHSVAVAGTTDPATHQRIPQEANPQQYRYGDLKFLMF
jgi:hypothetical protein